MNYHRKTKELEEFNVKCIKNHILILLIWLSEYDNTGAQITRKGNWLEHSIPTGCALTDFLLHISLYSLQTNSTHFTQH